ncbi:MAG: hypothetical protein ACE5H2_08405, partial [Terriglobia bacterium]
MTQTHFRRCNTQRVPLDYARGKQSTSSKLVFAVAAVLGMLLAAVIPAAAQKHYKQLRYPPLKELKLPAVERSQLANGLVLYLVEDHTLPKVEGYALIKTGARFEPADKVGLASIVGQVMRSGGTATRPGDARRFSSELVAESLRRFLLTLWNTYSFFVTYANLDRF